MSVNLTLNSSSAAPKIETGMHMIRECSARLTFPPFADFVNRHCSGYSFDQAMQLVNEGYELFIFLQRATEDEIASIPPKVRADKMAPFHWYLMYRSIMQEGEGFREGMIVFKDPGHRAKNFFQQAKGIYRRWSSHFCGRVPSSLSFCRFLGFNTNALDVKLSAGKKTVIFSELEMMHNFGEWTMIKAEDDPVCFRSPSCTVKHSWKWLTRSLLPRWIPALFGNHHNREFREELTPPAVVKGFKALVNEMIPSPSRFISCFSQQVDPSILDKKKKIMQGVDKFGIAAIFQALSDHSFIAPTHIDKAIALRVQLIRNFSHCHLATGKEVILADLNPVYIVPRPA